jgi:hypothetical protein
LNSSPVRAMLLSKTKIVVHRSKISVENLNR